MLTEYSMKVLGTQVFGPATGAMNYMEDGIEGTARMGDGSEVGTGFLKNLMNAGMRTL